MLLSIDRVLQLLAEGKSLEKISEFAGCSTDDVADVIEHTRTLIRTSCREESKRKILIKKKKTAPQANGEEDMSDLRQRFGYIELSAVPYNDTLLIHVDSAGSGSPGEYAIGIVMYDKNDQPVGKLSAYIGKKIRVHAGLIAVLRALEVAGKYKPMHLKIRTVSDRAVKLIHGEIRDDDDSRTLKLIEEINGASESMNDCRIECVPGQMTEKAGYLAQKILEERLDKKNAR